MGTTKRLGIANAFLISIFPLFNSALGQETAREEIENITVTAQRKAESIQSTPVSVTAFGANDIERMQIDNVKDLSQVAPNVQIQPVSGGSASIAPYVRGGTVRDTAVITSEAEVGIYIDDVYQPRSAASFIDMLDLERVEVLRGPQGTLYGRNSSAGAVKFISRTPDEMFRFKNETGLGSWNEIYNKLSVSGGLSNDGSLNGGISALYSKRDGGRQYNSTLGKDVGEERYTGFQGDLFFEGDAFDVRFKAFYSNFDSDGMYTSSLIPSEMNGNYSKYPYWSGKIDVVQSPRESYTHDDQYGANINFHKKINDLVEITSISAWQKLEDNWAVGFSGGVNPIVWGTEGNPMELFYRASESTQSSFSQEFQLTGGVFNDRLTYISGLYFFTESGQQQIDTETYFVPSSTQFDIETTSYALFGQATYQYDDYLDFTVGGRYTIDEKKLDASITNQSVIRDDSYRKFTPKLGADYKLSTEMLIFASYSVGFKAGGFAGLSQSAEALATPTLMQLMDSYEVGIKSDWMKNQFRLNISAFFNDYKKLQQGVVTNEGLFVAENYDAEHKGIEIESKFRVNSNLSLWANGVVQDNEYTATYSANENSSTGSLLGNRMTGAYDYQYATGIDYLIEIGDGTFSIGANLNRRGDYYNTPDNAEIGHVPALTLYDAYAAYELGTWKIKLAGKNLSNEKYWFTGFGFDVVQPRFMADPRTWRLSISYLFE